MLRIYKTVGEELTAIDNLGEKGSWINLVSPTPEELERVAAHTIISRELLEYPLDEEESSRIETDEGQVLIIIKIPVVRDKTFDTLPLGIIITDELVTTVCLEANQLLTEFESSKLRTFYTYKKTRFLLQILYKTAALYLRYLKQIDKKSDEIERRLHQSMKNEELISLLGLQKSLVYFTTSLKANEVVMEKLLRSQLGWDPHGGPTAGWPPLSLPAEERGEAGNWHHECEPDRVQVEMAQSQLIKMYEEDRELLEDVIIENRQAIDMGDIYTRILTDTMDAFASVISNNLNIVMKFLTAVTIVLAIPTMVASFYGMNVPLPGQQAPWAFAGVVGASFLLTLGTVMMFVKRRMF